MTAKKNCKTYSPNVLDYPSAMSMYEKESLAAEAELRATKRNNLQTRDRDSHIRNRPAESQRKKA
jgi:hypothetical protein